jgi:LCP family protein required for cell wall assembly
MKKTLFFLTFTLILTGLLFMSGLRLLAMVDEIEDAESYADGLPEEGDGDGQQKVSGFRLPVSDKTLNSLRNVLKGLKTEKSEPINVLLLVSDVGGTNTDAIMVAHYDPDTKQINAISVPRDTYVTVNGLKTHKVNGVYAAKDGAARLKAALEAILGQKIDYYAYLNLKTIREIVDLLDGVDYDVPCDLIYDDPDQDLHINIKKGLRTLTGKQVEGLLRFRHPNKWTAEVKKYYDGSDLKRIERQQDFMGEMMRQKLSLQYLPKVGDIISTVYSNIETDLPLSEMLKLANGVTGFSSEKFHAEMLPGKAQTIDGLSYYVLDQEETLQAAMTYLSDVPPPPAETPGGADGADTDGAVNYAG